MTEVTTQQPFHLFDECDWDDEDEGGDGGEWADGGVDEQLQHGDDQEVEVGDATELLEEVPEEKHESYVTAEIVFCKGHYIEGHRPLQYHAFIQKFIVVKSLDKVTIFIG